MDADLFPSVLSRSHSLTLTLLFSYPTKDVRQAISRIINYTNDLSITKGKFPLHRLSRLSLSATVTTPQCPVSSEKETDRQTDRRETRESGDREKRETRERRERILLCLSEENRASVMH